MTTKIKVNPPPTPPPQATASDPVETVAATPTAPLPVTRPETVEAPPAERRRGVIWLVVAIVIAALVAPPLVKTVTSFRKPSDDIVTPLTPATNAVNASAPAAAEQVNAYDPTAYTARSNEEISRDAAIASALKEADEIRDGIICATVYQLLNDAYQQNTLTGVSPETVLWHKYEKWAAQVDDVELNQGLTYLTGTAEHREIARRLELDGRAILLALDSLYKAEQPTATMCSVAIAPMRAAFRTAYENGVRAMNDTIVQQRRNEFIERRDAQELAEQRGQLASETDSRGQADDTTFNVVP